MKNLKEYSVKESDIIEIDGASYFFNEVDLDGTEMVEKEEGYSYTDTDSFSPAFQTTSHFKKLTIAGQGRCEIFMAVSV